jgi:hypothetical protein
MGARIRNSENPDEIKRSPSSPVDKNNRNRSEHLGVDMSWRSALGIFGTLPSASTDQEFGRFLSLTPGVPNTTKNDNP